MILQAVDLTEVDFETLRNEGLNNGDIVRIIAIAAMSLGETVVSRAIEAEPQMPEFAKDIKA